VASSAGAELAPEDRAAVQRDRRCRQTLRDYGPPDPKEEAMVMEWIGSSGSPGVDRAHSARINSSATQTAAKRIVRSAEGPVTVRVE
jgi:hypothetical protein